MLLDFPTHGVWSHQNRKRGINFNILYEPGKSSCPQIKQIKPRIVEMNWITIRVIHPLAELLQICVNLRNLRIELRF